LEWLDDLVSSNKEDITAKLCRSKVEAGDAAKDEALTECVTFISSSLLTALRSYRTSGDPSDKGSPCRQYATSQFYAREAEVRRARGEIVGDFLGIVDCCRISYLNLIDKAGPSAAQKESRRFVERFFDQLAFDFCREWCRLAEEEAVTLRGKESRTKHRYEMEVLGRFASGVCHEVRNPLHALMSLTEALKQELTDHPEADTYLHHIRIQIDRLSQLMRDLLEVAKPVETSRIRPESLAEICLSAIGIWKGSSSASGHTVSFTPVPEEREIMVLADSLSLQRTILNLLDNAAQYSPAGTEIKVAIFSSGKELAKVQVADRGSGIPGKLRQKIFEPFFSTRRGGTGLGLTVAKNVLESHGGRIAVWNNDPPPGSTFEILLPPAAGEER
jgi:signal transduction histidine kinase